MKPSTRNGLIAVAAVVLIGGGIVGFYYFRKRDTKKVGDATLPNAAAGSTSNYSAPKTGQQTSGSTTNNSTAANTTSAPANITVPGNKTVVSKGDSVNIRTGPGTSYPSIGKVNKGQKVGYSTGKQIGDWVEVYAVMRPSIKTYISKTYANILAQ